MDSRWRTSSRSGGNGQCVEARATAGTAQVRDSKDQAGLMLTFSQSAWNSFVLGLKNNA
ncbi:DUF397 domain-containing protein [Catenuloplanes sp. NPDC051500]|uniref:DUF397 domain-containing protein n=1 Tax=Catenuloplanes sp. NPDC051500 TaxID=3363959 RepID=UPI003799ED4C